MTKPIPREIQSYLDHVDENRRDEFKALFDTIVAHIPAGFELCIAYNMIGWVVPLSRYPAGYHVSKGTPLPFLNLAAQKRHIGLYHMGIYADSELLSWFEQEYPKYSTNKLNMGKSCIRFTNAKKIPLPLIADLMTKMTVDEWIHLYETACLLYTSPSPRDS